MNEMIEDIFRGRRHVRQAAIIRMSRLTFDSLVREKDETGHFYTFIDPFDETKWSICGLRLVVDDALPFKSFVIENENKLDNGWWT